MNLSSVFEAAFSPEEVQLALSVGIGAAGAGLFWIAAAGDRFDRYGREALFAAGVFFIVTGAVRIFYFVGALSADEARTINGLVAAAIGLLILQAAFLELNYRRRLR